MSELKIYTRGPGSTSGGKVDRRGGPYSIGQIVGLFIDLDPLRSLQSGRRLTDKIISYNSKVSACVPHVIPLFTLAMLFMELLVRQEWRAVCLVFPFLVKSLVGAFKFASAGVKKVAVNASFQGNGRPPVCFRPICPDFAHFKCQSLGARLFQQP
jgi:hypothetical protein